MPNVLQNFLAAGTEKAAKDLTTAFLRLPEDKRDWKPGEKARPAIDQVAEVALLNGYTADLIQTHQWAMSSFDVYFQEKAALAAQGWEAVQTKLQENTQRVAAAIRATPDETLGVEIEMPWSKQTLAEVLAYSHWNMTYHEGQINFLASILGCLD